MTPAGGHFRLSVLADKLTAEKCTPRFIALQRSGRYSELRIVQRGNGNVYRILGYRWPDKGARRRLGIGRARTNPSEAAGPTPNQVVFSQRGRRLVGWIHAETPTRYHVATKTPSGQLVFVWRKKNLVTFQKTDTRGKLPARRNTCPSAANPSKTTAIKTAIRLSGRFHGKPPRRLKFVRIDWPKALVKIGDCARVDYVSDKFDGKKRRYFHEFGPSTQVFSAEQPMADGKNILVVVGRFKIKAAGITG